jgi:hypothetical protein
VAIGRRLFLAAGAVEMIVGFPAGAFVVVFSEGAPFCRLIHARSSVHYLLSLTLRQ